MSPPAVDVLKKSKPTTIPFVEDTRSFCEQFPILFNEMMNSPMTAFLIHENLAEPDDVNEKTNLPGVDDMKKDDCIFTMDEHHVESAIGNEEKLVSSIPKKSQRNKNDPNLQVC